MHYFFLKWHDSGVGECLLNLLACYQKFVSIWCKQNLFMPIIYKDNTNGM